MIEKRYSQAQLNWLLMRAFKAGWRDGFWEGGDHDCRMSRPTADRAFDESDVKEWMRDKAKRSKAALS